MAKAVTRENLGFLSADSRMNAPSASSRRASSRRSASRRSASRLRFLTVRATAGDTVILPCYLPPEISTEIREFRWFKGTDCVLQRRFSEENEGAERPSSVINGGELNLTLRDVKVTDSGQYRCEILAEKKEEIAVIHLHVAEFKLVSRSEDVGKPSNIKPLGHTSKKRRYPGFGDSYDVFYGDDVTLPCFLSPETSAVTMEIRWFKGADCVYLYQNGQVTEGRGYEGRVSVITDDLQRGNVSLNLRDAQRSDRGEYRCEITDGEKQVEISVYLNIYDHLPIYQPICLMSRRLSRRLSRRRSIEEFSTHDLLPVPDRPGRRWSNPYEVPTMKEITGFNDQDGYNSS